MEIIRRGAFCRMSYLQDVIIDRAGSCLYPLDRRRRCWFLVGIDRF